MSLPTLSVAVVTYLREKMLCDTIEYLLSLDYPDWELLVVDQTQEHEPATLEFLHQVSHRIRYLRIDQVGMCHARNVAIEAAEGDVVLFCDDDIVPAPALLHVHARHYDDPSVGGVSGPTHLEPAPEDGPIHVLSGGLARREPFPSSVVETDSANGCNMSFRRHALLAIGGFDEEYIGRAHREETDASLRVRGLGYRLLFDPEARVEHLVFPSGGSRADLAQERGKEYAWHHNNAYFFGKHMPLWQLPAFARYQLGPLLYRQVWQKRRTHVVRPALAGLSDGFRLGRKARRQMLAQQVQGTP